YTPLFRSIGGEALEDGVEDTARLTHLHEVGEEVVEGSRVAAQRVGEGGALLDGTGHPTGDVPQILGLALFSEDGEALHEGQTGIDHGGELACEDRHLLVLDLAPGLRLGLAPRLLVDLCDENGAPAKLAHRRGAVGRLDL